MSHPPHDDWDEHDARGSGARHDDDFVDGHADHDHHDSLADEMLMSEDEDTMVHSRRHRRSPLLRGTALLLAVAVVVVAGIYAFGAVRSWLPDLSGGSDATAGVDYEGEGTGEVLIEIPPGAAGATIAQILVEEDVVGSASTFTAALQADPDAAAIQPGTYVMANQMSAQAALNRLLSSEFREFSGITVREGLWVSETFILLAEATGNEVADYEAVDPADLELPEAANGELEGYLFPSTYEFGPETEPEDQLREMVGLGKERFEALGIPDEDLEEVVIKASIIQGEGMFDQDLPRIARVMENRIEGNSETNGFMQMDSTIHYIFQERGLAGTTDAQRDDESPYNTYRYPGLPPGPINSPGEDALQAALNPEPGDWVYFVTVDPSTGETKFAETYDEHLVNQQEFLQWCEENPDQC